MELWIKLKKRYRSMTFNQLHYWKEKGLIRFKKSGYHVLYDENDIKEVYEKMLAPPDREKYLTITDIARNYSEKFKKQFKQYLVDGLKVDTESHGKTVLYSKVDIDNLYRNNNKNYKKKQIIPHNPSCAKPVKKMTKKEIKKHNKLADDIQVLAGYWRDSFNRDDGLRVYDNESPSKGMFIWNQVSWHYKCK